PPSRLPRRGRRVVNVNFRNGANSVCLVGVMDSPCPVTKLHQEQLQGMGRRETSNARTCTLLRHALWIEKCENGVDMAERDIEKKAESPEPDKERHRKKTSGPRR